jgi:hypothetical protein
VSPAGPLVNNFPFDPYDFFGYLAAGLLVLIGMDLIFGFPHIVGTDLKLVEGGVVLLMAYVAGQLVAGPSRGLLESFIVGTLLKRPSVNLFRERRPWVRGLLFLGYYEVLPKETRERVLKRAREAGVTDVGEALYLLVRFDADTWRTSG